MRGATIISQVALLQHELNILRKDFDKLDIRRNRAKTLHKLYGGDFNKRIRKYNQFESTDSYASAYSFKQQTKFDKRKYYEPARATYSKIDAKSSRSNDTCTSNLMTEDERKTFQLTAQAQVIRKLEEQLLLTKVFYEQQVSRVKSTVQVLETQLLQMQQALRNEIVTRLDRNRQLNGGIKDAAKPTEMPPRPKFEQFHGDFHATNSTPLPPQPPQLKNRTNRVCLTVVH